ncbi:MAG: ABC-F family ATP-binding cassette domain-containing protein [Lachnospiraceae bacterium]|nr:ABC-F family ATP-binding cassette domain-containing protein [Lachnospiraceae bacterium]
MNLLVADGLCKSYGPNELFRDVSLGINEGDKCGLIGVNGTGKSTLLRILAGVEEADEGTVTMRNGLRIAYLPQTPEFDDSLTLLQNVIKDKTHADAYRNLEGEARADLIKLGIPDPDVNPSTLSGGQRKRAALVRTLLTDSDFLILDEPTNHLDAEMTEWLEDTLKAYRGAFICITHDRYFLDEVTNRIFELDKGHLYSYVANYSKFIELKAEREESELATERKAKTLFKQELAWMLRGARARTTKQKAHIQRFEALRDRKKPVETENVEMFSAFTRMGRKTLEAEHIAKAYGDKCIIADFSYIFLQNERIGIVGPNGCGKSTLVKILTGVIPPDSGKVETGITLKVGYFAQECEFMDPGQRVLDYIRDTAETIYTKEGPVTASRMCERFLFNADKQYAPIGKLSGGEKRRLYLLKILMEAPNVLVLDEPTNDLDIMTLTILEDYLQTFEGIIIAVSHDRYFLDKLVNRIFVFRGNGVIEQSEGNYTDFREKELERSETVKNSGTESAGKSGRGSGNPSAADGSGQGQNGGAASWKANAPKKLKMTYAEQKEFETIEDDLAALEDKIKALEAEIEASATSYSKLNELMEQKNAAEAELEAKTERWLYLTELAEKIEAEKSQG